MTTEDVPVVQGPVLQSYSKEQMAERAKEYLLITFGRPRDMTDQDARNRFYERLGLLLLFIDHLWEPFSE